MDRNIMTRVINKNKEDIFQKRSPILKDPDVLANLKDLKFIIVTIDKASNNLKIAFTCKRFYVYLFICLFTNIKTG